MLDKILGKLGLQRKQPEQPFEVAGDAVKVMELRLGQKVRIGGSDVHYVAGVMTCERSFHQWRNYRLIHKDGSESWLEVSYHDDGLHAFRWQAISLFETPMKPLQEQQFAVSPDRRVPYVLNGDEADAVGEVKVVSMTNDYDFVRREQLEPVEIEPGTVFTYWQYCREDDPSNLISIEIWDGEKSYTEGREVDPNTIQVL